MTIESVRGYIQKELMKLDPGHPDRAFMEAQLRVFESFLTERSKGPIQTEITQPDINLEQKEGESRSDYLRRLYRTKIRNQYQTVNELTKNLERFYSRLIGDPVAFVREFSRSKRAGDAPVAKDIVQIISRAERDTLGSLNLTYQENLPLNELGLPTRAKSALTRQLGIYRRGDLSVSEYREVVFNYSRALPSIEEAGTLAMHTRQELSGLRNMGKLTLDQIEAKLSDLGLALATG